MKYELEIWYVGLRGVSKKYSRLTKNQTIAFRYIVLKFLDSNYLFIDLDFGTSATQIRQKLLEIHQLKDKISFS